MKVLVDQERCIGAGQCVFAAPDVFDQREEDGVVVLVQDEPSAERQGAVEEAARVCPAQAIEVVS